MAETVIEELTTTEDSRWFEGLTPETLYGIEVIAVNAEGAESPAYQLTGATSEALPPGLPPINAYSGAPGEEPGAVRVDWTEAERAATYTLRLLQADGQAVDELELTATEPGATHRDTLSGEPHTMYTVELTAYNSEGTAVASYKAGARHWLGADADAAPVVSQNTGEPWDYDRTTRWPRYLSGQVRIQGQPAQREVLILDRLTLRTLYRPRVGGDGRWMVANITRPPRDDWRQYAVLVRDLDGNHNAQIVDHVAPKEVEP